MLTLENGKKAVAFVVLGLVTMAVYQKFVAPMLIKKSTVVTK